jgi:hypothetical protein
MILCFSRIGLTFVMSDVSRIIPGQVQPEGESEHDQENLSPA